MSIASHMMLMAVLSGTWTTNNLQQIPKIVDVVPKECGHPVSRNGLYKIVNTQGKNFVVWDCNDRVLLKSVVIINDDSVE